MVVSPLKSSKWYVLAILLYVGPHWHPLLLTLHLKHNTIPLQLWGILHAWLSQNTHLQRYMSCSKVVNQAYTTHGPNVIFKSPVLRETYTKHMTHLSLRKMCGWSSARATSVVRNAVRAPPTHTWMLAEAPTRVVVKVGNANVSHLMCMHIYNLFLIIRNYHTYSYTNLCYLWWHECCGI